MKKNYTLITLILFTAYTLQSQSWQFQGSASWTNISTHTMFVDEDTTLHVAISSSGPYHFSDDEGGTFTASNTGLTYVLNEYPTEIKRIGDTLILSRAAFSSGSIWVKHISSGNWINRTSNLSGNSSAVKCIEVIGNNIFAGTKAGVYRSTDNGLSWINVKLTIAGSSSSSDIKDMEAYNDTLYIAGGKRLAYTTDLGNTWVDGQQNSSTSINCIAVKGSTVYLNFSSSNTVLKTTDGGSSYSTAWTLPTNDDVKKILIHNGLFFYQHSGSSGTYGHFYYSTDNAQTFQPLSAGITYTNTMKCSDMTKTTEGILSFWTTDASSTPPTYSGIYKLNYADLISIPTANTEPSFSNNSLIIFPNPSSDLLNINTTAEIYSVTIYNPFGQIVLQPEVKNNSINTEKLSNGIHFLEILTSKGVITKRFVKQ